MKAKQKKKKKDERGEKDLELEKLRQEMKMEIRKERMGPQRASHRSRASWHSQRMVQTL